MKLLIMLVLLFLNINASNIIQINDKKVKLSNFEILYYINDSNNIDINNIHEVKFKKGKNKASLGRTVKNTWIKIVLRNNTKDKMQLSLHQSMAFTLNKILYFEKNKEGELLKKEELNIQNPKNSTLLKGSNAIYPISINPKEIKTLYINQESSAYHFYNFSIFDNIESIKYLIYEKADGLFFFGLLLALAWYNFLFYISTKYKEYLFYSLYLFSATIWIFYMYGSLAHYFNVYGEIATKFNFALMLIPIFLTLFIQSVFETKYKYKKEHLFLNSVITLLSLNFLYGLINYNHSLVLLSITLNYSLVVFLLISISIYKKGNQVIKIFLIAHIFYIAFTLYGILFYIGMVEFNYISSHSIGIGIIIEALTLSYLISYKYKKIENEKINALNDKIKAQSLLNEKNKLLKITNEKSEELKVLNKRLEELSITDKLTSLYNRTKIDDTLQRQLKYTKRYNEDFSLILIDIDFFKKINDTYGHQVGDTILKEFAQILKDNIRQTDTVGRWGGEEFIIICPKTNLEEANIVSQKIKNKIEKTSFSTINNCTASFGISTYKKGLDIKDIVKNADEALYKAKSNGRNTICYKI
ncbi:diguanylate cyclase [Arcobacter sp. YIC-80]|uniref:sensor domain-containing diguanylate cyclase n=1 Tax=Arcobacter sp. YIC-80 TaxID=3376683 RepID=UPI00384B4AD5